MLLVNGEEMSYEIDSLVYKYRRDGDELSFTFFSKKCIEIVQDWVKRGNENSVVFKNDDNVILNLRCVVSEYTTNHLNLMSLPDYGFSVKFRVDR